MLTRFQLVVVVLLTTLLFSGCGRSPSGPETVEATGVVTLKGQPLSGATVAFRPVGAGRSCDAITDDAGHFELQTYLADGEAKSGVVPGEYQVTVIKLDEANLSVDSPPKNLVPTKYSQTRTSGLAENVGKDGPNEFTFELK